MKNSFRTLDDAELRGKRVLVRVDLNLPMENGRVTDATRIDRILPTVREIVEKGGKVILLAHFGRPKGGPDEANSLKPIAPVLAEHLIADVGQPDHAHERGIQVLLLVNECVADPRSAVGDRDEIV